jgi:hypothetical protein
MANKDSRGPRSLTGQISSRAACPRSEGVRVAGAAGREWELFEFVAGRVKRGRQRPLVAREEMPLVVRAYESIDWSIVSAAAAKPSTARRHQQRRRPTAPGGRLP